jgi:hypothetical protein
MAPICPLPTGNASSQLSAGCSYHNLRGDCACAKQAHRKVINVRIIFINGQQFFQLQKYEKNLNYQLSKDKKSRQVNTKNEQGADT